MTIRPKIFGIAGGSGSGKSTVARSLVEAITHRALPIVSHDNYYHSLSHLTIEERAKTNFDHPRALDNELLIEHLKQIRAGQTIEMPLYNFATHTRMEETVPVEPAPVVVVEGLLVLVDRALRDLMDIKVFVDIDADIRFIRRLQRDVRERGRSLESVIEQYQKFVRPMHLEFVEPSKRYADVIIPVGGRNQIAIDMLSAKLRSIFAETGDDI